MKATLNFDVELRNDIQVIRVSGPLDSVTYDQFKAFLDPLLTHAHARIVLDCTDLTYVNSRGVTLLIHYQRTCAMGLSFLGIAGLRPRVLKGIEMLGLGHCMKWYPTLDDALHVAAAV